MSDAKYTAGVSFMAKPETVEQVRKIAKDEEQPLASIWRRLVTKALRSEKK